VEAVPLGVVALQDHFVLASYGDQPQALFLRSDDVDRLPVTAGVDQDRGARDGLFDSLLDGARAPGLSRPSSSTMKTLGGADGVTRATKPCCWRAGVESV